MAYSEIKIAIGVQINVPVLIFISNFIKSKFGIEIEQVKSSVVKEEIIKLLR